MPPTASFSVPAPRLFSVLLALAALDSFAGGVWALARPGDLFEFLQVPAPADDARLLWSVLGAVGLVYGLFLVILITRPGRLGMLALAPLLGRLIGVGLWLFVLGSGRGPVPVEGTAVSAYLLLAARDGAVAIILAAFLVLWWRAMRQALDRQGRDRASTPVGSDS